MFPDPIVEFSVYELHLRVTSFAVIMGVAVFVASSWALATPARREVWGPRPHLMLLAVLIGGFVLSTVTKPLLYGLSWCATQGTYSVGWIAGSLAVVRVASWMTGRSLRRILDVALPALLLGASIGRWGCLSSGCCHGPEVTGVLGWRMTGGATGPGHYLPTPLLHSLACAAGFIAVTVWRKHLWTVPGRTACFAATWYSFQRLALGFLRLEPRIFGPLSVAQCVAAVWLLGRLSSWARGGVSTRCLPGGMEGERDGIRRA